MDGLLPVLGFVFFAGFAGSVAFKYTRIPEPLFLISIGLLAGPVLGIIDTAMATGLMPLVATLTIIVVMLDNGLTSDIYKVARALPATIELGIGIMLATAAAITAVLVAAGFSPVVSMITAFILAGTTTDVITAVTARLSVPRDTKQFLVLESVANDVQIVPFFILLGIATNSGYGAASVWTSLLGLPAAAIAGALAAAAWITVLDRHIGKHPLNYAATVGILLLLYGAAQATGANGPVAILAFSLVLGNAARVLKKFSPAKKNKKFNPAIIRDMKRIEVDVSFFIRSIFFFFLGAVFSFSALGQDIVMLTLYVMIAALISRFAVLKIAALKAPHYKAHTGTLTWIMPRGYVAAVLAFTAAGAGVLTSGLMDMALLVIYATTLLSIIYAVYHEWRYGKQRK